MTHPRCSRASRRPRAAGRPQRARGRSWCPTSEPELAAILEAYGQPIGLGGAEAPPTHLLRVYLIDGQRRIRNVYGLDFLDPRLVLNDVRTLLLEERRRP